MGPEELQIDEATPEICDGGHIKSAEELRNLIEGALEEPVGGR